jgi:hypothetical protein
MRTALVNFAVMGTHGVRWLPWAPVDGSVAVLLHGREIHEELARNAYPGALLVAPSGRDLFDIPPAYFDTLRLQQRHRASKYEPDVVLTFTPERKKR